VIGYTKIQNEKKQNMTNERATQTSEIVDKVAEVSSLISTDPRTSPSALLAKYQYYRSSDGCIQHWERLTPIPSKQLMIAPYILPAL
jgi:hypothetical protein